VLCINAKRNFASGVSLGLVLIYSNDANTLFDSIAGIASKKRQDDYCTKSNLERSTEI
jgi:hypothetical protein